MPDVTGAFTANFKNYLRNNPTRLSGMRGYTRTVTRTTGHLFWKKTTTTSIPYYNKSSTEDQDRFSYTKAPATLSFAVTSTPPLTSIVLEEGANALGGVVYLPYRDNAITMMSIPMEARWFFTGPLQGCHVYIASNGMQMAALHVNMNRETDPVANDTAKGRLRDSALAQYYPGYTVISSLSAGEYRPPGGDPYEAFVIGHANAPGDWKFYVHSVNIRTLTVHRGAQRF